MAGAAGVEVNDDVPVRIPRREGGFGVGLVELVKLFGVVVAGHREMKIDMMQSARTPHA